MTLPTVYKTILASTLQGTYEVIVENMDISTMQKNQEKWTGVFACKVGMDDVRVYRPNVTGTFPSVIYSYGWTEANGFLAGDKFDL